MKLLVILICLLSERYLVHAISHTRFNWFNRYFNSIQQYLLKNEQFSHPAIILTVVILPLLIICGIALWTFSFLIFGLVGFILNLIIFYYCLGPDNPFYPLSEDNAEEYSESVVGNYFVKVNGQLFAVMFWYIVFGAIGALAYRLFSLSKEQELTVRLATQITNLLDWIPARISVILFLMVGNFQRGFNFFTQNFFLSPESNDLLLSEGGLLAARTNQDEPVQMPYAESLVEHATIVYLVFLALFTLVALL